MNGFTPGPWIIFHDNGLNVILPAMRDGTIADMIRNDADAYLIAAAPDLLGALKLILPLAKGYAPEGQSVQARKTCDSWIDAADAAIGKAEGRS